jgi:hypothetical protein
MASVTEGGIQGATYSSGTSGGSLGTGEVSAREPTDTGVMSAGKEQVKRFGGVTRDRVYHQVDNKKDDFIKGLQGFVSTLENASKDTGGIPRQVLQGTVGYIRKVSDRIENGSTEDLMRDARHFIREKPAPFFAGCVALGFLAARILKE